MQIRLRKYYVHRRNVTCKPSRSLLLSGYLIQNVRFRDVRVDLKRLGSTDHFGTKFVTF